MVKLVHNSQHYLRIHTYKCTRTFFIDSNVVLQFIGGYYLVCVLCPLCSTPNWWKDNSGLEGGHAANPGTCADLIQLCADDPQQEFVRRAGQKYRTATVHELWECKCCAIHMCQLSPVWLAGWPDHSIIHFRVTLFEWPHLYIARLCVSTHAFVCGS